MRRTSSRRANLPPLAPITPPRPDFRAPAQAQYSPILHTRFRGSTQTAATSFFDHERSTSDATSTWGANDSYAEDQYLNAPEHPLPMPRFLGAAGGQARGESMVESVYSQTSLDIHDVAGHYRGSWQTAATAKPDESSRRSTPEPILPTVVVEAEQAPLEDAEVWPPAPFAPPHQPAGRTPSRVPVQSGSVNFSRPVLPPIDRSEERKREVLRRNQQRLASTSPTPSAHQPMRSPHAQYELTANASRPGTSMSAQSRTTSSQPSSRAVSPYGAVPASTSSTSLAPSRPQRPPSPVSLYSHYSYYQLDSPTGSSASSPHLPSAPGASSPHPSQPYPSSTNLSPNYVPSPRTPASAPSPTPGKSSQPTTPEDFLQLGIRHHEANRLEESAVCFEKSATLGGGCGVGMLMWGLAQRHGWGCAKNEQAGFRWLRRAAEVAVDDLERARKGMDTSPVKSELVLAIYEVGQSFFQGWGVEKDKKMAVSYFRVAARLGDPDAQQELGFCLANGKGCKKDKMEAAKWYRAAVAQGVSDIGLTWIYKDKYQ